MQDLGITTQAGRVSQIYRKANAECRTAIHATIAQMTAFSEGGGGSFELAAGDRRRSLPVCSVSQKAGPRQARSRQQVLSIPTRAA
jgi:hypothetical protein